MSIERRTLFGQQKVGQRKTRRILYGLMDPDWIMRGWELPSHSEERAVGKSRELTWAEIRRSSMLSWLP